LAFEGEGVNSLNYDLRSLGRSGVLSINLVATMPELGEIRAVADDFSQIAAFDAGARYTDFDASTDAEAGYGIAGLVAGGVGLAVAKKAGLLVILLKFIKPILIGLALLVAALRGRIGRLFGFGKDPVEEEEFDPPAQREADDTQRGEGAPPSAYDPEAGPLPPRSNPPPRED